MQKEDIYNQINRLMFAMQRLRRKVAAGHGVPAGHYAEELSFVDRAVLLYLEAKPGQNIKEISEKVGIERSWMSRTVTGLLDRGLLQSHADPTDSRSKVLKITSKGKSVLKELEKFSETIMHEVLQPLSIEDRRALGKYFKAFADGLNERDSGIISDASVHHELARISRAVGIGGDSFMGSEFSSTDFQILLALTAEFENGASITDLAAILPFDQSTLSRAVSKLESEGVIERSQSLKDQRSAILVLSSLGINKYAELKAHVTQFMTTALASLSKSDLKHFAEILKKLSPESTGQGNFVAPAADRVEMRALEKIDVEREANRISVDSGKLNKCNNFFGLYINKNLRGVVAYDDSTPEGVLNNFVMQASDITPADLQVFLRSSLSSVKK